MLAKAGAAVDAHDNDGDTPLHKSDLLDVDEELLKLGLSMKIAEYPRRDAALHQHEYSGHTPFSASMERILPFAITEAKT